MNGYILSIDQSTQGTKAMIFDAKAQLVCRSDKPHRQLVNELGWVGHDMSEILENTLGVCDTVIKKSGIDRKDIVAVGVTNQRETVGAWDRVTGRPLYDAIVWQCARASELCAGLTGYQDEVKSRTGLNLSPYFSASKAAWMIENVPAVSKAKEDGRLCIGTMDSWIVFNLTDGHSFKTDFSNASRTQLFNIHDLCWDEKICGIFGVSPDHLPEVCMSDELYGYTDLGGILDRPVPLCGVLGDSHAALLGQGCRSKGEVKATYGTGSSVMMNTGEKPFECESGLVTSLAWGLDGKVEYVLEGNLNYTGAVVSWMRDNAGLISDDAQSEALAKSANQNDRCCFVPAFTGLGAPYWDSDATGTFTGITRTTGRAELVKAGLESIGYQITDLVRLMAETSGIPISRLRVDGGATANGYLMQFQSDISGVTLEAADMRELSGFGAAVAAGMHIGLYDTETVKNAISYRRFSPVHDDEWRNEKYSLWQSAVRKTLTK